MLLICIINSGLKGVFEAFVADLAQTVEGSDAIGFGEGWVVEYHVSKIIQSAAHGDGDLTNVDDFSSAFADGVHAEDF